MQLLSRKSGFILLQRSQHRFAILLAVLVFLVYLPSLFFGFVWDDHFVVDQNDFIKSWKNIKLIFTKQYLTKADDMSLTGVKAIGSGESSYRPVVTLSYFLDYAIWKLRPFGYHLHNLVLHIFNTLLVYFFVFRLSADKKVAFLTGLLFALAVNISLFPNP